MKRTFEAEWPDEHGPLWMNRDNLLLCLTRTCRGTEFTVQDVTNDGECDPSPNSGKSSPVVTAKPPAELTMDDCREVAARCWCDPVFEQVVMDVDKAELIARLLHAAAQKSSRRSAVLVSNQLES